MVEVVKEALCCAKMWVLKISALEESMVKVIPVSPQPISSIRVLFQVASCGVPSSLAFTAPYVCLTLWLDSVGSGLS